MYFMGFELSEQKKLRGGAGKATILAPRQRALESFDIDLPNSP
jgi:hypothetical protein